MPPRIDYVGNCIRATERQGLVPIMVTLAMNDIPFRLDQTGGYCMVLVITRESDDLELGIINDGGPWWLVVSDPEDENGEEDDVILRDPDVNVAVSRAAAWERGEI